MKRAAWSISERQQVLLIIPLAVLALLVIWLAVLRPQYAKRAEIVALRGQLARSPYARFSLARLKTAAEHERDAEQALRDEWALTIARLATFPNQELLRRTQPGRIDYKMGVFEARSRLLAKSDALGIPLIPQDLGLQEALGGSDDEVRVRMLQLRAVEKLADLTLDRRIQRLHAIQPLAPVEHVATAGQPSFDEYPVQVTFDVDFDNLYMLFQAVFEEGTLFVFRNLRIEAGPTPPSPLRIRAVMSALLFE